MFSTFLIYPNGNVLHARHGAHALRAYASFSFLLICRGLPLMYSSNPSRPFFTFYPLSYGALSSTVYFFVIILTYVPRHRNGSRTPGFPLGAPRRAGENFCFVSVMRFIHETQRAYTSPEAQPVSFSCCINSLSPNDYHRVRSSAI